jgi:hypothetical protein
VEEEIEIVQKVYKKLKANIFYDKTQLVLRNKLVEFESMNKFEETLENIYKAIFEKDEILLDNLSEKVLGSINVSVN